MYDETIKTIKTIDLDETTRARLVPDFESVCPFEWMSLGNAHTLDAGGRVMSMSQLGADDPEGVAIEALLSNADHYSNLSQWEREEAVLKHLRRNGYHAIIANVGSEDYHVAVFYDKGDGVSDATIQANISTYVAWALGAVYGVIVERQRVWHSGTDTMTTWEPVGSLWGIYAPTEDYIREVADDILADSAAA